MQDVIGNEDAMEVYTHRFTFDRSFWSCDDSLPRASQETVFDAYGQWVLDNAWGGYNCSIFAYGQTGAGKPCQPCGANTGALESEEQLPPPRSANLTRRYGRCCAPAQASRTR